MPSGMYHLLHIKLQAVCGNDMCGERIALDSSYRLATIGRAMIVARRGWWCGAKSPRSERQFFPAVTSGLEQLRRRLRVGSSLFESRDDVRLQWIFPEGS